MAVDRARHKQPGNLNDGLPVPQHDHDHNPRQRPVGPDRSTPPQGGWEGKANPDGSHTAKPAGAQPATSTTSAAPTPATQAEQKAKIESDHTANQQFQLDMLDMQQRFQQDQWWITTLATIQKTNHDSKMELSRKFG